MDKLVLQAPKPGTVCWDCARNKAVLADGRIAAWCEHSQYGGVYHHEKGFWSIYGPITEQQFIEAILGEIRLPTTRIH